MWKFLEAHWLIISEMWIYRLQSVTTKQNQTERVTANPETSTQSLIYYAKLWKRMENKENGTIEHDKI